MKTTIASMLLMMVMIAVPVVSHAKSTNECNEFISTVKKEKLNYKQSQKLAKQVKFRKKEDGYDCERLIQEDKPLMRQLNLKLPAQPNLQQEEFKLSSEAVKLGQAMSLELAKNNKRVQQLSRRLIKNNEVMSGEADCEDGPRVMRVQGIVSWGNNVILTGGCFGGTPGQITLNTGSGANNWDEITILEWVDSVIMFTMPAPRESREQPRVETNAVLTIRTANGRALVPIVYKPKMLAFSIRTGFTIYRAWFFGLSEDRRNGNSLDYERESKLWMIRNAASVRYELKAKFEGRDRGNAHWRPAPGLWEVYHVGCAGECRVRVEVNATGTIADVPDIPRQYNYLR